MSLHDALSKFKAALSNAVEFADPETYVKEAETAFKHAVTDKVTEMETSFEERFKALEAKIEGLAKPAVTDKVTDTTTEAAPSASTPESATPESAPGPDTVASTDTASATQ